MRDGADGGGDAPFPVFASNWPALRVFIFTWNQWHTVAGKEGLVRLGMNWCEVKSALNLSGIKRRKWPEIFNDLHEMQRVAINIFNEDDDER